MEKLRCQDLTPRTVVCYLPIDAFRHLVSHEAFHNFFDREFIKLVSQSNSKKKSDNSKDKRKDLEAFTFLFKDLNIGRKRRALLKGIEALLKS